MQRGAASGVSCIVLSSFAFSVMALLVKLAGRRLPSQEIVFARALITLLLSWAMIRREGIAPWGTRRRLLLVRGLFGFLALSCFYHGVTHLPMAEATVIQYTNPVFTALFAALVLAEPLRPRVLASIALSLSGVVLVTRPAFLTGSSGAGLDPLAVAISVCGAIASALAYVTVRRLSATEHSLVIVWYFAAVALPASVPALVAGTVWPVGVEWLVLAGVGISTQVAQVALTRGLALLPASTATAISYLQVVFATLWGATLFSEWRQAPDLASRVPAT
jgi:drug/metabolite transporter (DMT)-like permease